MESIERQNSKSRIEEAKKVILNASSEIEKEFKGTANSWLACFGSCVFQIEIYLFGKKAESELGGKDNIIQEKIENLKQRLYDLKQQYPDKNTVPPDEIKQELLVMLDVLK